MKLLGINVTSSKSKYSNKVFTCAKDEEINKLLGGQTLKKGG